jgi:hypothetical protein
LGWREGCTFATSARSLSAPGLPGTSRYCYHFQFRRTCFYFYFLTDFVPVKIGGLDIHLLCLQGLQDKIELVAIDLQDKPAWYKEKVYPQGTVR